MVPTDFTSRDKRSAMPILRILVRSRVMAKRLIDGKSAAAYLGSIFAPMTLEA